jgi:o-succinylbenzoate synthase
MTGRSLVDALEGIAPPGEVPGAARCGLETALLDLAARRSGLPLARYLNPRAGARIAVNANAGSAGRCSGHRLRDLALSGFGVIKLKVGMAEVGEEIGMLQRLACALPPSASLRLDANRAWTLQQAEKIIEGVSGLPVESLEEPLKDPDYAPLRELQHRAPFPLALDESLIQLGLDSIIAARPVRRLVLKAPLAGGLLPALARARAAHRAGFQVQVTSSLESAVGVWSGTHLAAALGDLANGIAHGLATSSWLIRDTASAPQIEQGVIRIPERPGLGLEHLANPVPGDD